MTVHEMTMSQETIILLRKEIVDLTRHGDVSEAVYADLANLGEGLSEANRLEITIIAE